MSVQNAAVDVGRLLRHHRARAGLTQQQLADLSCLSVRALRNLEGGRTRRPHPASVNLLADTLRLSDAQRAELTAAAAGCSAAPDPTSDPAPHPPVSAPVPATALFGREPELELLRRLLADPRNRAVTLVGPPGVGKTQLAVAAVADLHERLSVVWVSRPAEPSPDDTTAATIVEHLRAAADRPTLLVLDDHDEHWIPAEWIVTVLQDHPLLQVLTTGPRPGRLPGSAIVPLPALPVPSAWADHDVTRLRRFSSMALLEHRIERVRPGFRLGPDNAAGLAMLCRTLDGLPGALVTAAELCLLHPPEDVVTQFAAATEPFLTTLLGLTPWGTRPVSLARSIDRVVDSLDPEDRRVLDLLCELPEQRWALPELAHRLSAAPHDVATSVHHLLVLGLVRREERGRSSGFVVLNLVRLRSTAGSPRLPRLQSRSA